MLGLGVEALHFAPTFPDRHRRVARQVLVVRYVSQPVALRLKVELTAVGELLGPQDLVPAA